MKKRLKSSRGAGLSYSGGGASKPVIYQKSAAFTLAEVLITLGIIGVVAALTMPAIISNTNGKQKKVQFQKTLSVLNQAVKMSKAQDDIDFTATSFYYYDNPIYPDCEPGNQFLCNLFAKTIKGVKGYSIVDDDYLSSLNSLFTEISFLNSRLDLPDGSSVIFEGSYVWSPCIKDANMSLSTFIANGRNIYCLGLIDVNGTRPPNKEVSCVNASDNDWISENSSCTVDFKNMGDIFPVVFYNDTVAPATNAANYVLINDK